MNPLSHAKGQSDMVGSGRAIRFDGIDDYIDLGNTYQDVNLPFSLSAWIFIDPSVNSAVPIFVSNDNDPIYRGFWFFISQNLIWCEFGDGTGGSNPAFRRGKQAIIPNLTGRWINVCAVMKSPFEINLFVNGIDVGGNSMGSSNLPMASSFSTDHPKIGYFLSNNITYRFKGMMDEVKIWNRALSLTDIRDYMCSKQDQNAESLIGHWDFNELNGNLAFDKSVRSHTGTLVGIPTRVFSGAPLGDQSTYQYNLGPNFSLSLSDQNDFVTVSNVLGDPEGVHIYKVLSSPSQTNGLDISQSLSPYFGVFVASLDQNNSFDLTYLVQNATICNLNERADNSISTWQQVENPVQTKLQRGEFLPKFGTVIDFDLGEDVTSCEQEVILESGIVDPQVSIQWSTGESTSAITVNEPGKYWIEVSGICGVSSDSLWVTFQSPPAYFSLGEDKTICPIGTQLLKPYLTSQGYDFIWQDGTKNDLFEVTDYGTYWVSVKNECGELSDTISFTNRVIELDSIPNVITPNGDAYNEFFILTEVELGSVSLLVINRWGKQVYHSDAYKNDWNASDLSEGVYFYTISGNCINEVKGSISILR